VHDVLSIGRYGICRYRARPHIVMMNSILLSICQMNTSLLRAPHDPVTTVACDALNPCSPPIYPLDLWLTPGLHQH
jgi:hypothetical protein